MSGGSGGRARARAHIDALKAEVEGLRAVLGIACGIIETADARLLAGDSCSGLPPDMSLAEWQALYEVLDKARKAP